ncbi:MAG: porin [Rhizomicrobium sp.]
MATVAAIALVASTGAGLAKSPPSYSSPPSASTGPSNAELSARIDALEAELAAEQDRRVADHSRLSGLEQSFNDTTWTFDNARPVVKSGDGRFSLAFRVRFQADFANFLQDSSAQLAVSAPAGAAFRDLSSGAVVRRAFFGVEGKAFNDFWYEFRYNAGGSDGGNNGTGITGGEGDGSMSLARVAYTGIDHFMLNVGVIEPALMFEGTTSSGQLMFIERPEIDNIAADTFGAGDARRGIEVRYQKQGVFKGDDNLVLNAAFTGAKTGTANGHGPGGDERSQILGRISYRAWSDGPSNLAFGVSGAQILYTGGVAGGNTQTINLQDRPEIRVDGTRLISTGGIAGKNATMYAFDAGFNYENFFIGGEYANFQVDRFASGALAADHPNFSGWYIEGSWILTGETKTYTVSSTNNEVGGFGAPAVSRPFSLNGNSWGALELTARYSDTDLNWHSTTPATLTTQAGINGGHSQVYLVGVNWYLNRNVKLVVDDMIVKVDKFSGVSHVLANNQGQDLNILGVRLQFTN